MRTQELRSHIRQRSILTGAVVALGGFLYLLFTEQLHGMGDLITKAALSLMLGAGVWFIVEQVAWHVCNGKKRRNQRKMKDH